MGLLQKRHHAKRITVAPTLPSGKEERENGRRQENGRKPFVRRAKGNRRNRKGDVRERSRPPPKHSLPLMGRDLLLLRRRVLGDPLLHLGPKVPDEPLHGPRRRIPQRADRVSLDLLGHLPQHIDLLEPRVAAPHPRHDVVQPARALAAGGALAARLVLVEVGQAGDGVDGVRALVHHDHWGGGGGEKVGRIRGLRT